MKKKIAIKGMRIGLLMAAIMLLWIGLGRILFFEFFLGILCICVATVFLCIREISLSVEMAKIKKE